MNNSFFEIARTNMVNNQILPNGVKNSELINSFDNTKKELFVPESEQDIVYSDCDILMSPKRYLVRSFILAKMLDHCSFTKDDSVLIIGCVTGYSMAIISNLVSYVFGIENNKNFVERANNNLSKMGFLNCSVFYKTNLISGNNKNSPYDKIFIEGSVQKIPDNIIKQLKEDGEVFTVLREDDHIGQYVKGQKVGTVISFTKLFNTNLFELKDFVSQDNGHENEV